MTELPILYPSAEPFFHELIEASIKRQDVEASKSSVVYLTHVLAKRVLFFDGKLGDQFGKPLVYLLEESIEDPEQKMKHTKDLGEIALVVVGIFQDSLLRHRISPDYYITMGSQAYNTLANLVNKESIAQIYNEVAKKFPEFVRVLNEVAEQTMPQGNDHIVNTYTTWLETRSETLYRRLLRNGIMPQEMEKEKN